MMGGWMGVGNVRRAEKDGKEEQEGRQTRPKRIRTCRDDNDHADEVQHQHDLGVLEQNLGQADGHLEALLAAVGVAVLFIVLLGLLVGQRLVRLGNLLEHLLGLLVTNVLVGVELERQAAVGLFNLARSGAVLDAQDGVRVVLLHLARVAHHLVHKVGKDGPGRQEARRVDQKAPLGQPRQASRLGLDLVHLGLFRLAASLAIGVASGEEGLPDLA